jgi:hypothetical protein
MRVGYAYAPDSFSDDSTVHQVSVMVLGGWTGETRWAPFVETGLGWLLTIVPRHGQTQGDPLGWAARLGSGVQVRSLPLGLRLALAVELQSVRVDSIRRYDVVPRLELAATF